MLCKLFVRDSEFQHTYIQLNERVDRIKKHERVRRDIDVALLGGEMRHGIFKIDPIS